MTFLRTTTCVAVVGLALVLGACGSDDDDNNATNANPNNMTTPTSNNNTTTPTSNNNTTTPTSNNTTTPTTNNNTTTPGPDMGDDMGGDDPFVFRTDAPGDYQRVDRVGMPAVSTALIGADQKNAYNDAGPAEDANLDFAGEIVAQLTTIHTLFDDDLAGLSLTPCSMTPPMPGALPPCLSQVIVTDGPSVVSLAVPDTLSIDTTQDAGFPNGRLLADPVMDVTLAIILLDMTVHSPTTLVEVPVNPTANDVNGGAFPTEFPYLHPAQTP